jgi:hypothetical protein
MQQTLLVIIAETRMVHLRIRWVADFLSAVEIVLGLAPRPIKRGRRLHSIDEISDTDLLSAVGAAEDVAVGLEAVADDAARAVRAARGEGLDRTLEAVKGVCLAVRRDDLKGLVVIVAAGLAYSHRMLLSPAETVPVVKTASKPRTGVRPDTSCRGRRIRASTG